LERGRRSLLSGVPRLRLGTRNIAAILGEREAEPPFRCSQAPPGNEENETPPGNEAIPNIGSL